MDYRTKHTLSKFLSLILRHEAKQYGLTQDEEKFVDINKLIDVVVKEYHGSTNVEDILYILNTSMKNGRNRYQIVGNKVRATYNHSQ